MDREPRLIKGKLTVIIRDMSPLIFMEEPVEHRTVHIQLTEEQIKQLTLHWRGTSCGREVYEDISSCFLEE